jgi:hypothetical protein
VTLPPTPLQLATQCAADCLLGARESLSDPEYAYFVSVLLELAVREAERLAYGEALRARREASE